MLYFGIFTAGYFLGVFTVLAVFPPRVKEIQEQEKDALRPILESRREVNGAGERVPESGLLIEV